MRCLVTGAAGFIGSNFVSYLNRVEPSIKVYLSDYLTNGKQYKNLLNLKYENLFDPDSLINYISGMDYVFHFGAVSSTTEWNGEILIKKNYVYTMNLISDCVTLDIPIQYASSASVYGNDGSPLNLYAYFKSLVDKNVDRMIKSSQKPIKVQGFRFFNVFGPNEWHKGDMASPYHKFTKQALETGVIKIFEGSDNFYRDFVPVEMVCDVMYKMIGKKSGIYELGTGHPRSFRDIANEIAEMHGASIEYIPFPEHLKGHYQTNTKADMSYLNDLLIV